jgi:hypothetical protein
MEAAIARAKLFDPLKDRTTRFFVLQVGSSSDARQATEMHEIQVLSVAEGPRIGPNFLHRQLSLEGNQSIEAKDRVIKITSAGSISEAPILRELSPQKIAHEPRRIFEDFRREPSHLEHF